MAEEIISGINPTRMELLALKDREQLAVKGHSLLKEKRDALIKEFFDILDKVQGARDELNEELAEAYEDLTAAQIQMGDLAVQKAALSVTESMDVDIKSRNIMGVSVPVIDMKAQNRTILDRGYGFNDTSIRLDEAAKKFEHCLKLSIQLGEIEKTIYLLAAEIEATKRRVNALEHIMVPRLQATIKSIDMRLQEMERENFVRLKMIRATIEKSQESGIEDAKNSRQDYEAKELAEAEKLAKKESTIGKVKEAVKSKIPSKTKKDSEKTEESTSKVKAEVEKPVKKSSKNNDEKSVDEEKPKKKFKMKSFKIR
jgi:V/A-type H+/Na+-transporting ATPase subunit D